MGALVVLANGELEHFAIVGGVLGPPVDVVGEDLSIQRRRRRVDGLSRF
jgi:hypothetical protein